nr:hypothetical protein GCM10020093_053460 [Planobispora longispora]
MAHAVVVGAGIGGLTAAVALQRRGWEVTVLERAASLEPVGSGLAIAVNALRALDTIGAGDEIRKLSAVQGDGGVRSAGGRWLARTSTEAVSAQYGDSVVLLRRAQLVDILVARLAPGAIRLNTAVTGVDPATGQVSALENTTGNAMKSATDAVKHTTDAVGARPRQPPAPRSNCGPIWWWPPTASTPPSGARCSPATRGPSTRGPRAGGCSSPPRASRARRPRAGARAGSSGSCRWPGA